ncbi:hypothetical protein LCGC14_2042730 [marine sediment metagenome]|uniref:Uncharacterized protein n=1 Tax=marine sediment metagenome TaxID=412755 RepID=A0A0F9H4U2_9ZZZZ
MALAVSVTLTTYIIAGLFVWLNGWTKKVVA